MNLRRDNNRFALALLVLFLAIWTILAIRPSYRHDWLLENMIVFVGVPFLILTHRRLPLSRISYALIFLFLCLHEVGAHYTYAEVPYDRWLQAISGTTLSDMLGLERNHFDRVVHFLWGLLLVYPVREIVIRVSQVKGFWAYLLPVLVVVSTSTLFELIEWAAAVIFGGDLGIAYLGTQGDEWDAQKDMALALAGSLVASVIVAAVAASLNRDFAREWTESLRVKRGEPLGEFEIERLLAEKRRNRPRET
jgi:putative membrane protein